MNGIKCQKKYITLKMFYNLTSFFNIMSFQYTTKNDLKYKYLTIIALRVLVGGFKNL